jgi:hypothetical protein
MDIELPIPNWKPLAIEYRREGNDIILAVTTIPYSERIFTRALNKYFPGVDLAIDALGVELCTDFAYVGKGRIKMFQTTAMAVVTKRLGIPRAKWFQDQVVEFRRLSLVAEVMDS